MYVAVMTDSLLLSEDHQVSICARQLRMPSFACSGAWADKDGTGELTGVWYV